MPSSTKKGSQRSQLFELKTDYLEETGILADDHTETIPLERFDDLLGGRPGEVPARPLLHHSRRTANEN